MAEVAREAGGDRRNSFYKLTFYKIGFNISTTFFFLLRFAHTSSSTSSTNTSKSIDILFSWRRLSLPFIIRCVKIFPIVEGSQESHCLVLQYSFDDGISVIFAGWDSRGVVKVHQRSTATEFIIVTTKKYPPYPHPCEGGSALRFRVEISSIQEEKLANVSNTVRNRLIHLITRETSENFNCELTYHNTRLTGYI